MARNVAYYIDPDKERRKREAENEVAAEAFGPPPPPPNLGVMSKAQVAAADIEAARARALSATGPSEHVDWNKVPETVDTDEDLSDALDALAEDPAKYAPLSQDELARAVAYKKAHGLPIPKGFEQPAPVAGEAPGEHELDVLLDPQPIEKVAEGALLQRTPLGVEERKARGLPATLGYGKAANPFEEEAQAYAAAQKAAAPKAVDKTAASVADEQKGVPAAQTTPPPIGHRTDAMVAKMENEPPAVATDHAVAGGRFYQDPSKGLGFLGVGDLPSFRDERMRRVQELYGQEDPGSTRWEDEFLRGQGDAEKRAMLVRNLSLLTGDVNSANDAYDRVMQQHAARQQGVEHARGLDAMNRRVPQALAEAIAATGQVSPEAAVKLRMNDPLVKNFGQYASQGGRTEGQQIGLRKNQTSEMVKLITNDANLDNRSKRAWLTALNQADGFEARGLGMNQLPTEAQINGMASLLGDKFGGGPENGKRILQGDLGGVVPGEREQAQTLAGVLLAGNASRGGLGSVYADFAKTEVTQPHKDEMAIDKAIEIAQRNPKTRFDIKSEWTDATLAVNNAYNAWTTLSQDDQDRFAQWASKGFAGNVKDALSSVYGDKPPAELLTKYAQVQRYVNAIVKRLGGSSVTGSEWGRIADELGIVRDDWSPFKSGDAITQHMIDSAKSLTAHHDIFVNEFKDWESL